MKVEFQQRVTVPGKEDLSCKAWSQDGKWATEYEHKRTTTFYEMQPNWKFYYPTEESKNSSFYYSQMCDRLRRLPGDPHCYFLDDWVYTLGFPLEDY